MAGSCGGEVIDISLHYVVIFHDQGFIPIEFVIVEREEYGSASPFGGVAEATYKDNIFWGDIGDKTVWQLSIAYIPHDLRSECGQIKIIK